METRPTSIWVRRRDAWLSLAMVGLALEAGLYVTLAFFGGRYNLARFYDLQIAPTLVMTFALSAGVLSLSPWRKDRTLFASMGLGVLATILLLAEAVAVGVALDVRCEPYCQTVGGYWVEVLWACAWVAAFFALIAYFVAFERLRGGRIPLQ